MSTGTPAPVPGDTKTTLAEDAKRIEHEAQASGQVQVSRTGAIMGRPDAEHSMYGMRRDDAPGGETASEREIRGVEPATPVTPATPAAPAAPK